MDAHSLSFTSASRRATSRIWKDLTTCRLQSSLARSYEEMDAQPATLVERIGKRRADTLNRKPHIGVIGAGLAGLRCTDVLLQHGFQVTLIEGRSRLGGRVHQVTLPPGHVVDAGPNWIHGTKNNPILDLAKETGTAFSAGDLGMSMLDEEGALLPQAQAEAYSTTMWDMIEAAFHYSNDHFATISPRESLWDFFQKEVVRRIPDTKPGFQRERDVVLKIVESWGAFVGSPVFSQSLKYFWLEECIEGENLFCSGTYEKILEHIARPAREGALIKYETVVTNIRSTGDEGGPLVVSTRDGESLEFDEVVLTAPLGWLKQHPEAFDPPLPPRLTKAIESIGYGCLEKVYISFPEAFWLRPESEADRVRGFCQWLAPNYAPGSNPHKWNQEMVELGSAGMGAPSHPTLLFYTYGDQSRYLTGEIARLEAEAQASGSEKAKAEAARDKTDAFLYAWFRPYYARLPGYSDTDPGCRPSGCHATRWLRDELAGNGSYSNFQTGLEAGDADVEAMRAGAGRDRGLWLAGEHTAPFVALGTATGAYWSGEHVADRVAEAYCRMRGGVTVVD